MSRADYAHWNEEADIMWWQEEGRHVEEAPHLDDYDLAMRDGGLFDDDDDDDSEYEERVLRVGVECED